MFNNVKSCLLIKKQAKAARLERELNDARKEKKNVHLCLLMLDNICLPMFTHIYLCLIVFIYLYHSLLVFTYI